MNMCGIVGAIAFNKLNKKDEQDRQRIMRYMTTELLLLTEDRGKDATGAAILFSDGNYVGMKRGEKVSDFLSKLGESKERYGGLLKIWKEHEYPVKVYLGHARATSQGSKDDNANNHPIKIGNIIGIHNGTLRNDDVIIKNLKCKRDGQVDSEAIFRLFEYYTNKGKEPFTLNMVQDVVRRLEGQFAVTLFNSDNPYQVPVFRDSRPVEFVFIKKYRMLFIVSELKFWSEVLFKYESDIFYHGLKYPSLLECDIEKESLVDDSCMIFDLMSKIDEDTKIRNLGVWRKMERNGKLWTVASDRVRKTTAGFKGVGSYNSHLSSTKTKNKDEDTKPKRIFDRITKKYTSSGEEKNLADDESITIPAGTGDDEKNNNENTSENKNLELKSTDEEKQESTEPATEIKDLTVYNKEKNKTNVIEKNSGIEKDDNDTVDVDMTTEPPEYVSAAEEEYRKLDFHKKGYNTTDELLDAIEKRNESELNVLDKIVFANKVFKDGWKKGFVAGCKYLLLKMFDKKNKKRENHIVNLKRLVMILVTFLDHIHIIGTSHHDSIINKKMNSIALEYIAKHNIMPNMAELRQIFNIYEKGKLKNVDCIISEVSKYKEEDE
jgi:glucosamine 6-phosphate synthetase-like amidotransferase/phosphosugar isomerase protein